MKILFKLFLIFLLTGCEKNTDSNIDNLLISNTWLVTEYKSNGVSDHSIVSQNHTYEFRGDGKVYFSQTGPVYRDTLLFEILNNTNIKLTKPSLSSTAKINLQVDMINDSLFDFTLTSNLNTDIDTYKTKKQ